MKFEEWFLHFGWAEKKGGAIKRFTKNEENKNKITNKWAKVKTLN